MRVNSIEAVETLEDNTVAAVADGPKVPKSDVFRDGGTFHRGVIVVEWCFSAPSALFTACELCTINVVPRMSLAFAKLPGGRATKRIGPSAATETRLGGTLVLQYLSTC